MKTFTFILKNEKLKTYEKISWLLIFINLIFFIFLGLKYNQTTNSKWFFIGALLVTIFSLFSLISNRFKNSEKNYGFVFTITAIIWFEVSMPWLAVVNILLMIFEIVSKRKMVLIINNDLISYPSFPAKELEWEAISNLILKDGILTIDLKNNKLIQINVEESAALVDEKDFNDFCKECMKKEY